MNTKIRGLRLDDIDWGALRELAAAMSYPDVTSLIRAIARGELSVSKLTAATASKKTITMEESEEAVYDKNFDWGA